MNILSWVITHPFDYFGILRFYRRVKDYNPKQVSIGVILKWLNQFPSENHHLILSVLPYLRYYSEQKVKDVLIKHNQKLLAKLEKGEVTLEKVIYVTVDKPASSSQLMLNILRDAVNLERKGVHLIDSRNVYDLVKTTTDLGNGAIIYVDDFAGTGEQFLRSRNYVAEQVPLIQYFSEFFLLPCICREAFVEITKAGVEIVCDYIHDKNDRPLHPDSIIFDEETKKQLINCCKQGDSSAPLGFGGLASMVVFYRNTPNTVPIMFRGNVGQDRLFGILPRTTDLTRK